MYKILIVEDEPSMSMGLRDNLEFEGYQVDTADEGKTGLQKVLTNSYNLILLDVMIPHMSGFDICRTARHEGVTTPIILLTAKGEELDKVLGLELGADDYITKPFSLRELLARIKAVLRRSGKGDDSPVSENGQIAIGNLSINFDNYEAFIDSTEVKMSHKEIEILHYLWNHRNQTVSRDDLLDNIWGTDYHPTTRTVDNFILKLRQKIEKDTNTPKIILTVHGVGYKMLS